MRSAQWFGYALAKRLGFNVAYDGKSSAIGDVKDIARIKTMIKTWIKNQVLAINTHKDETRKDHAFIVPGPESASSTTDKTPRIRWHVVGPADSDVICQQCGQGDAVMKVRKAIVGAKTMPLHERCAAEFFSWR
jgi:hypothetical protein